MALTEKTEHPPKAFLDVFRQLVRRTTIPGGRLEPETAGDYWALLRAHSIEALAAAAERLAATQRWFPSCAEWIREAQRESGGEASSPMARAVCPHCRNKGLVRVMYESGEPFDVGICNCEAGSYWRAIYDDAEGVGAIRARLNLCEEHAIAPIEDFEHADESAAHA